MEELDLRDKFALYALNAVIKDCLDVDIRNAKLVSNNAYAIAEAMLEARVLSKDERLIWATEGDKDVV